jgi:carbamoyltransferase
MNQAFLVKECWRERIPGVVHPADGTTRPHIVRRDVQPRYHGLLTGFFELTGVPALLNTSLNDRGQPIANSVGDAVRLFFASSADVLMIGSAVVRKC